MKSIPMIKRINISIIDISKRLFSQKEIMDTIEIIHLKGTSKTLKLREKRNWKMKQDTKNIKKRIRKFDIEKLSKEIIFKNIQLRSTKSR